MTFATPCRDGKNAVCRLTCISLMQRWTNLQRVVGAAIPRIHLAHTVPEQTPTLRFPYDYPSL